MANADEDDAAAMGATGVRPRPGDPGEVAGVEGDHNASFGARQVKETVVGPAVKCSLLVHGSHVVPALA